MWTLSDSIFSSFSLNSFHYVIFFQNKFEKLRRGSVTHEGFFCICVALSEKESSVYSYFLTHIHNYMSKFLTLFLSWMQK